MSKLPVRSLWPREHGAYAQLVIALASGFALGVALTAGIWALAGRSRLPPSGWLAPCP